MAKFHGSIGFVQTMETKPGIWEDVVTEMLYKGDILRNTQQMQSSDEIIPEFNINMRFSIILDAYALANLQYIRFVEYEGSFWSVVSVEIQRPRLILTARGVYNG